jgi:hypothetical protein
MGKHAIRVGQGEAPRRLRPQWENRSDPLREQQRIQPMPPS